MTDPAKLFLRKNSTAVLDVEALEFLAQSSAGFMSVSERIVSRCGMFRLIILQTPKHQLNEFLGFLGHANNINKTASSRKRIILFDVFIMWKTCPNYRCSRFNPCRK
jgi:hypothetical protein